MNTHSGASVNRTGHMANCQEASRAGLNLGKFPHTAWPAPWKVQNSDFVSTLSMDLSLCH